MRRTCWMGCVLLMLGWCESRAAIIALTTNTGGDFLSIVGTTGDIQIRLTTFAFDTIPIAYLNAFLDVSGPGDGVPYIDVVAVTAGNGAPWVYDRSAFAPLPAELEFLGDEYGLVSGDPTPVTGGYPLGNATYIHDTITVQSDDNSAGDFHYVNFELGARSPQAFGPGPTFLPFVSAPSGTPQNLPNWLYIGDFTSGNPALTIDTFTPEPGMATLLALASLALRRRRIL